MLTDTTATSGLVNLLVRPLVWVSVQGSNPVQHEGYQWEQLTGDLKIELKFASKAHSESDPILGLSKGLHDCNVLTIGGANQADVFMLLS